MFFEVDQNKTVQNDRLNGFWFGDLYASSKFSTTMPHLEQVFLYRDRLNELLSGWVGEFSFVCSQSNSREIFFGRDAIGVCPLYYAEREKGIWVFSTSFEEMLMHVKKLAINEEYLRDIIGLRFDKIEQTPFLNIKKCPPGCYGVIQGEHVQIERYWRVSDIARDQFFNHLDECVHEGRRVLTEVLADRLSAAEGLGLLLSGGLDSSLIAAKIQKMNHSGSGPAKNFRCFTMRFQTAPEEDAEGIDSILPIVKNVVDEINGHEISLMDWAHRQGEDPNVIFYEPTLWLYKPMLKQAQAHGIRTMITGLGGDDLFEPDSEIIASLNKEDRKIFYYFHPDFSGRQSPRDYFWRSVIKPGLIRLRSQLLSARKIPDHKDVWRHRQQFTRTLSYKFVSSGKYLFGFEGEQEFAQKFGQRMTYPLLDRRVLDFLQRVPPEFHYKVSGGPSGGPYVTKPLLRSIAEGLLPKTLVHRQSQQSYENIRKQVVAHLFPSVSDQLDDPSNCQRTVVDRKLCEHFAMKCRALANRSGDF